MMLLMLVLVILSLSDDVCAVKLRIRTGPIKIRTGISSSINRNPSLKKKSWEKVGGSYSMLPGGRNNGYGGFYTDNSKMKIMFSHVAPRKISRYKIIDVDKLSSTTSVKKGEMEIVKLTSSVITWLRTDDYKSYGKNSEFYDDDKNIYFDIYYVDTITNHTTHRNATLKHIQVRQCLHSLRVSKSSPHLLLYACDNWLHSPYVILWIPCVMLLKMWLVVPVSLAVLYVKNMQGQIRSCFLYADAGTDHQYGRSDEGIGIGRKRKLRLTGWIGFLAALLLSAMILTFCLTSTDLYQEDSQDTILKTQLFRAGLTFLALSLLSLLSLFTTSLKIKLYKFPFYMALLQKGTNLMSMELTDDCGEVVTIFYVFLKSILGRPLTYFVFCAVSLVGDLCLLVVFIPLKIVYLIMFEFSGFLTQSVLLIWAKVYLKEINLKHYLYYSFLR